MKNLIIIPALNPNDELDKLVAGLKKNKMDKILVVNDGTTNDYSFDKLDVPVIHHEKNMGKGAAIKTALNEYKKYYSNIDGFITVDADGQHSVDDVLKINKNLKLNIIFGVRDFKGNVPLRSKIGNKFSSLYLYLTKSMKLKDTQTGLRGFPKEYRDLLLSTEGNRFDYEMNVLKRLADENVTIDIIPIKTIYIKKNVNSNFSVLRDSYNIYKSFFISLILIILVIIICILLTKLV